MTMNSFEVRAASSLSLVFALRMLGLFMLLPVLAVYSDQLRGSTPALVGIAIGAYGISQALLQIPAGLLSDRIGRKPVIICGLFILILGSVVAGSSDSIYGVIAGRILQGTGAIAAAVTALLADLTRDEFRTRAMAILGVSIGVSFCLAMVLGPLMVSSLGLSGLFYASAILAVGAIVLVTWGVPVPVRSKANRETVAVTGQLVSMLKNRQLMRLNVGVFVLHFLLVALFIHLPLTLQNLSGLPREEHWWVYLVTVILSFFGMVPFIVIGEKRRKIKTIMSGAIALLLLAQGLMMVMSANLGGLVVSVLLFFMAFNYLEATLPSLISRIAPAGSRGSAMGIFSTCQFMGAGLGGITAGYIYQNWSVEGVFFIGAIATAIWLLLSVTMRNPPYVSSIVLDLYPISSSDAGRVQDKLAAVTGVKDVTLIVEEQNAYLKVDKLRLDEQHLRQYGEWQ